MLNKVTIFDTRVNEGTAKKTGVAYRIAEAQCLLHATAEGEPQMVGQLMLPKGMPDPVPGDYIAEFRMAVGQDGKLGARLHKLNPVAPVPRAAAPVNQPPKA
ncbi:MAG: cellulose synthase [Pedosphaera sp.]|nr:cellulose synthase [Pedosphaera sp.]